MATEARNRIFEWCKDQRESLQQQLDLMKTGRFRLGEDTGKGWRDTTDENIDLTTKKIAELDRIIAAYVSENR